MLLKNRYKKKNPVFPQSSFKIGSLKRGSNPLALGIMIPPLVPLKQFFPQR